MTPLWLCCKLGHMGKKQRKLIRRRISVSVCAPMFVTMTVRRASDSDAWEIEDVVRVDAEISARGVTEHADDATLAEIDRLADAAPDLEES